MLQTSNTDLGEGERIFDAVPSFFVPSLPALDRGPGKIVFQVAQRFIQWVIPNLPDLGPVNRVGDSFEEYPTLGTHRLQISLDNQAGLLLLAWLRVGGSICTRYDTAVHSMTQGVKEKGEP
jgi:hypothetical protein